MDRGVEIASARFPSLAPGAAARRGEGGLRAFLAVLVTGILLTGLPSLVRADDYPSKPKEQLKLRVSKARARAIKALWADQSHTSFWPSDVNHPPRPVFVTPHCLFALACTGALRTDPRISSAVDKIVEVVPELPKFKPDTPLAWSRAEIEKYKRRLARMKPIDRKRMTRRQKYSHVTRTLSTLASTLALPEEGPKSRLVPAARQAWRSAPASAARP